MSPRTYGEVGKEGYHRPVHSWAFGRHHDKFTGKFRKEEEKLKRWLPFVGGEGCSTTEHALRPTPVR